MNTYVGGYIISTVGEYVPDSQVRMIHRQVHGWPMDLKGDDEEADFLRRTKGGEDIGCGRKFETMVFKAKLFKIKKGSKTCCPYRQVSGGSVDCVGYNRPEEAFEGHMKLCEKWSRIGEEDAGKKKASRC
jgi:hypothetical protein